MRRSPGRRVARAPVTASWRCVRSGPCSDAGWRGGARDRRGGGAPPLRQARRLPGRAYARRSRCRGCAVGGVCGGARPLAGRRHSGQSGGVAPGGGAAQDHRRGAAAPHQRACRRRSATHCRGDRGRGVRNLHSGPAAGFDVRLRASGDRSRHARAADAADHSRLRRRHHRVRLPGGAGCHEPAAGPRQEQIRQAGIPFRVPEPAELRERLDAVLEAIHAVFAEGRSGPAGTDARRRNLAGEGIWLGRLVGSLMPEEPEALGLLALMLHAEARREARRNARGDYVPLGDQDPDLWDTKLIDEAEALLSHASRLGVLGRYQLEAAVQSAHAVRRRSGQPDWGAIEQFYDALLALTGSPVVAINRAIAIAETRGPAAGLAALDALADDGRLAEYQPYWAARAGLLRRLGRLDAANEAYALAIGLEADPAVRVFLQQRRAELWPRD